MSDYVRVSDILKRFQDYADVDPEVLEAKARIGTNVHKAILQDCADGFVILESDRARAYFQSYELWKSDNQACIKQIPRLYCDKLMLTGECDGLLNASQLIDWKCSASPSLKIWEMQAHFYYYLLNVNNYTHVQNEMVWINLRHKKSIYKDPKTKIGEFRYYPVEPVIYRFKFNETVMQTCLDEVHKYWEEKNSAHAID